MPSTPSKPLAGRCVVVTRPKEQSEELCAALALHGAEVLFFPVIKIEPPEELTRFREALARLHEYDWLLFSSQNAVQAVYLELGDRWPTAIEHLRVAAVGAATAESLARRGARAHFVPTRFSLAVLSEELPQAHAMRGMRMLHPCGDRVEPSGTAGLFEAGAAVDRVIAYRTLPDDRADASELLQKLNGGVVDALVFASPSAVACFEVLVHTDDLPENVLLLAIGPRTARALASWGRGRVCQSAPSDAKGLIAALLRVLPSADAAKRIR